MDHNFLKPLRELLLQVLGAIAFYTIFPIPQAWPLRFDRIARWAPLVGLLLGTLLTLVNQGLAQLLVPPPLRASLVVCLWIALTGGLHLDGVMDAADGLGVCDGLRPVEDHRQQRLQVMADSRSGAFGVMAAIALVLLKVQSLAVLDPQGVGGWLLLYAPLWGRWGQVLAIGAYPLLKTEGKGAIHHQRPFTSGDWVPGAALLAVVMGIGISLTPGSWLWGGVGAGVGMAIAWGVGGWFNHRFQGMTGDLYGAIVEWSECLFLVAMGGLVPHLL
jgi:adenosylcobinamide-GDP ribazoletransferase